MAGEIPAELTATELIGRLERHELPEDFLEHVSKGLLPLPQDELVEVLARLTEWPEEKIAAAARASLRELPPEARRHFAQDAGRSAQALDRLATSTDEAPVLESIVRNRAASDETVAKIARSAGTRLQEAIVINQARILRHPAILDALLENPRLALDVRRRVLETREEFFEKQRPKREPLEVPPPEDEEPVELTAEQERELAALLAQAEQEGEPSAPTLRPPEDLEEEDDEQTRKNKSIWTKLSKMSVSEKVQAAFKGSRSERAVLIQDRNKFVCTAVVRNPRVAESEAATFAAMRNIETEVLRLIGANREWMRKYPILFTLVRNPKAPPPTVIPLLTRLTNRDLRSLLSDKNLPEAVRLNSRKLFLARTQGFQGK